MGVSEGGLVMAGDLAEYGRHDYRPEIPEELKDLARTFDALGDDPDYLVDLVAREASVELADRLRDLFQAVGAVLEAPTADEAARQLDGFEEKWAGKYPSIAPAWRRAWAEVIPFFAFSEAIRKIIYTTNAVESLNRVLRKTLKTKGSFPTEEAATKLIFLAIRNFEKGGRAVREWVAARNQLAIMFAGRFDA